MIKGIEKNIETRNLQNSEDKVNEQKETRENNSKPIDQNEKVIKEIEKISNEENIKNTELLSKNSIDDIKSKILLAESKTISNKAIKEETNKRIKAYTSIKNDNWLELNYKKFGSGKNGKSHEMNIGLGDILLDPSINKIQVKRKNGEIINGTRRVDAVKGVYFVDKKNNYLATYTGDSFKVSNKKEESQINKEKLELSIELEQKARIKSVKHIQEEKISEKDKIKIKNLSKSEKNEIKINKDTVKYAEQLSQKKTKINTPRDLEKQNPPLSVLIKKTANYFGVPKSLMYATFKVESNFKHNAYGDKHLKGGSLGIGQFRPETFNAVSKTKAFKKYIKIHYPNKQTPFKRGENLLADITATAIYIKQIAKHGNINLKGNLSESDKIYIRAGYNAGIGNAQKYKNQFMNGKISANLKNYIKFTKLTNEYELENSFV